LRQIALLAVLSGLLGTAAYAQQPYIETFEVRLHNLDVVVTDAQGRPVPGLTKDDFIVTEDGKPQEITNFSEYSESAGSASARGRAAQAQQEPPQRAPRKFVFFLDELSLHPASRNKLLKSALALLNNAMAPGDEAAVIRPYGEQNVLQSFTSDKKAIEETIRAALEASNTRADTRMARELMFLETQLANSSTVQEKHFAIRLYTDIARRRVEQRLGQLLAIVGSLSGVEGKKVLVLATASLAAQPGREAINLTDYKLENNPSVDAENAAQPIKFPDLTPRINDLGRIAAANGVTIYSLQPDVPLQMAAGRSASDTQTSGGPGLTGRRTLSNIDPASSRPQRPAHSLSENFFGLVLDNTEITMKSLAETTGGKWFRGDGTIDDAFETVSRDLGSYYSLAYRAQSNVVDRPTRVEVRIKGRNDLQVRTRTDVVAKSDAREMDDLVVASLVYPREVNELGIRAVAGEMTKTKTNRFQVPVVAAIPMQKLTFLPAPNGRYRASFTVHYAATGDQADFFVGQHRRQDVEITAEQKAKLDANELFHYRTEIVVAQGRTRIAVGVLDEASKLSGFSTVEVLAQ
jgi:VWFA-related protein